ncbi:MAG: hypothetical protein ACK53L_33085, partial [Pirellulaceae bacterium]
MTREVGLQLHAVSGLIAMIHAKYLIQHPRLMTASVACLGVAACFFAAGCQSMNGRWRSLTGGL